MDEVEESITYALIDDDEETIDLEKFDSAELSVTSIEVKESSSAVNESYKPAKSPKFDEEGDYIDPNENVEQESNLVTDFVAKRKAQFRAIKLNKRKIKLYIIGGIAVFLVSIIILLESPIFTIDKVQIVQTKNITSLTSAELTILNKSLSSVKGQQIYRSNFKKSNTKVGSLNFIKNISYKKKWPSTLKVIVTHRVPIATIKTNKGYVLVDDENVIYEKVNEFQQGLPVFKGFDEITFSKKIPDKNYIEIVKSTPKELKNQIAYVEKKDSKYFVTLTDGIVLNLGDTSLLKEKMAIAWSIILTKNRSDLGYIDVSVPSLPVSSASKV